MVVWFVTWVMSVDVKVVAKVDVIVLLDPNEGTDCKPW